MVPRITGTALLIVLTACAVAQKGKTLTINFAAEGPREVWIQKGPTPTATKGHQTVSGKSVEIEVPDSTKDMIVCVLDSAAGLVAVTELDSAAKKGKWDFDLKTANHTDAVVFLIQHEGQPVSSAVVRATTVDGERETLLTPTEKGLAVLPFVAIGDVSVTVDYKSEGQDRSLPKQTFSFKSGNRAKPTVLAITDVVETVAPDVAPATKASAPATPEKKAPTQNPAATFWQMLLGAVIIAAVAYAIYRYVTQNPEKTAAALGAAGVPMGSQSSPGQPKPPGPPKQIILEDQGAMGIGTADATGSTNASPIAKNPRLVKADGTVLLLQEGSGTVGRDAGAEYPHPAESSVSRSHANLSRVGDTVTVTDTGSTNGTFVNGRRVSDATVLSPGDAVQFGAVQYRYEE